MSDHNSYYQKELQYNTKRLRYLVRRLPSFCGEYFRGIEHTTLFLPGLIMPMILGYSLIFSN